MSDLNKRDLDNYITGHYGQDQFDGEDQAEREDEIAEEEREDGQQLAVEILATLNEWWVEAPSSPVHSGALLFGGAHADKTIFDLVREALKKVGR